MGNLYRIDLVLYRGWILNNIIFKLICFLYHTILTFAFGGKKTSREGQVDLTLLCLYLIRFWIFYLNGINLLGSILCILSTLGFIVGTRTTLLTKTHNQKWHNLCLPQPSTIFPTFQHLDPSPSDTLNFSLSLNALG